MPDNLEAIVQRMIDAGESEDNIATVIQSYQTPQTPEPPADDMPGLAGAPSFLRAIGRVAKTAYDNPVQALGLAGAALAVPATGGASLLPSMAAAGLGGAGGAGLGTLVKAARGDADTPQTPGAVLGAMGQEGALQAAGQGTGALAAGAARGSLRLMQSALKPTASLVKSRAGAGVRSGADIAKTVLQQGRIISPGSLAKAQAALDATDDAALDALRKGAGKGVTVDPQRVLGAIGRTEGQFGAQINPAPDVASIRGVADSFAASPRLPAKQLVKSVDVVEQSPILDEFGRAITRTRTEMQPAGRELLPIPAVQAHEIASNTGKNLKGKFGRLGGATVEAEKAGRASITEQLRQGIPALEPLWKQEAAQITTRDAIEQALMRRSNTDPLGLTGIIGLATNPMALGAAMADRSGMLKSVLAQALAKSQTPLRALPTATRVALASRLQPAQDPKGR